MKCDYIENGTSDHLRLGFRHLSLSVPSPSDALDDLIYT